MEKAREELSAVVSPVLVKCTNNASFTNENSLFTDLRGEVKLEFVRNSFDLIRKFAIQLIRKGKEYSKNSMKINSKFVLFDSTPTIGWSQIL